MRLSIAAAALVLATGAAQAQGPAPASDHPAAGPAGAAAAQRGPGRASGRGGERGFAGEDRGAQSEFAPLLFEERWNSLPNGEPMTQPHIENQNLMLHTYGDTLHIRKTDHPTENYTYTGETLTNWAITLSDPKNYWDLSGIGRIMLRTHNTGMRITHIVIKTADGSYYVSEEGSPDSASWIEREYILSDLHWFNLLMTDHNTNASNRRLPDPNRVPIVPTTPANPNLGRVEEIGFSDLMPGGWIPSTSRVGSWAVYGKDVPR